MLVSGVSVPRGTEVRDQVARRETPSLAGGRCSPSPVSSRGSSRRLIGVRSRDDRPRVGVGGRFAGEIAGVELLEGGVDVVESNQTRAEIRFSASISIKPSTSV